MEIFTNSEEVINLIPSSIKVHLFNNLNQNSFQKSYFFPLIIVSDDFKELDKLVIPYAYRKKPYDLVVLINQASQVIPFLINNDVLAILRYPFVQTDIDMVLERYEFRKNIIQDHDFSKSLLKINRNKIILTNNVKFIRAFGNYTLIFTVKERLMERTTLSEITDRLPKNIFIQTHRSYVVNINSITEIKMRSLKIQDDTIPISSRKKCEVLKLLENQNMLL